MEVIKLSLALSLASMINLNVIVPSYIAYYGGTISILGLIYSFQSISRCIARLIHSHCILHSDCEVYIVGSFARKTYTLSSDLDILIVSSEIPEKINFEWYVQIVKSLTEDLRINIHLLNRGKLEKYQKMYSPMIKVL